MVEMAKSPNGMLSLDRFNYYKDVLSQEAFNDLEIKQLKAQEDTKSIADIVTFLNNNKENAIALNALTSKQLDSGFKEVVATAAKEKGSPLSLSEEAQLASTYDVAFPEFNKKIDSAINSKQGAISAEGSQIYEALAAKNPNVVGNVSKDSALRANMMGSLLRGQTNPDDAAKFVADKIDNLSAAQVKERKEFFKEVQKDNMGKAPSEQLSYAKKALGFERVPNVPPGMLNDFNNAVQLNYVKSGDWGASVKVATDNLKLVYKKTNINGYDEVMFLPPDINLPTDFVREHFRKDLQNITTAQSMAFGQKDSKLLFKYEMVERQKSDVVAIGGFVRNIPQKNVTRGIRTDVEGNKIPGQFIISPDRFTQFPEEGQLSSYGILFLPDGKSVANAVYDPTNKYNDARFRIPVETAEGYINEERAKLAARTKDKDAWIKYQQDLRDKVITMRLEQGEEP